MNQDNTLSFIVGAALGGIAGYYLYKHQDQIVDKIHELEGNLNIDHNSLIEKAKSKLDTLTQNVQSTIERYTHGSEPKTTDEITAIMTELARLREEVRELSAH
jgi:polyhydroxyalkanoate synthesis regulator phasin